MPMLCREFSASTNEAATPQKRDRYILRLELITGHSYTFTSRSSICPFSGNPSMIKMRWGPVFSSLLTVFAHVSVQERTRKEQWGAKLLTASKPMLPVVVSVPRSFYSVICRLTLQMIFFSACLEILVVTLRNSFDTIRLRLRVLLRAFSVVQNEWDNVSSLKPITTSFLTVCKVQRSWSI